MAGLIIGRVSLKKTPNLFKPRVSPTYLKDLDCLGCYGQFECPYNAKCMTDIKVSDVYKSIGELIWN